MVENMGKIGLSQSLFVSLLLPAVSRQVIKVRISAYPQCTLQILQDPLDFFFLYTIVQRQWPRSKLLPVCSLSYLRALGSYPP